MKSIRQSLALLLIATGLATGLRAEVIAFDDTYADLGNNSNPATYYAGVTFSGNYFAVVGGNGNGDPGNWNLFGTNGSAFLGTNSGIGSGPTITWDSAVSNVSLDIGEPGFGWTNDFTIQGFLGNTLVASSFVTIGSPSDPGLWATVYLAGVMDSVTVTLGSGNGFGFGVDNISWESASVPDQGATLLMVGCTFLGLTSLRRYRAQR